MRAFDAFINESPNFWATVKFVSEQLGYSHDGIISKYSQREIDKLWDDNRLSSYANRLSHLKQYLDMRADLLNGFVKSNLMSGDEAKIEFEKLYPMYKSENFHCDLPMNKQKGDMRNIAYFTAIINILSEKTIRDCTGDYRHLGFDDDPRGLVYFYDNNEIIGASSRRFDGAYPSIKNPSIVWEIKEYYYNKSFGSRIADGVYETQLDGYEFRDIRNNYGYNISML